MIFGQDIEKVIPGHNIHMIYLHRLIDGHHLIRIVPVVEDIVNKLLTGTASDDSSLVRWVHCSVSIDTRQVIIINTVSLAIALSLCRNIFNVNNAM